MIASFFYLVIAYLGEDDQAQRAVFRRVKLKKWMWCASVALTQIVST